MQLFVNIRLLISLWRLHAASPSHPHQDCVTVKEPERQVRNASHCGSEQQQRSPDDIPLLLRHLHVGAILSAHPFHIIVGFLNILLYEKHNAGFHYLQF